MELKLVDRKSLVKFLTAAIKKWHTSSKWEDIRGFYMVTEDIHMMFKVSKTGDMFKVTEYGTTLDKQKIPSKLGDLYLPACPERGMCEPSLAKDVTWFMHVLTHLA